MNLHLILLFVIEHHFWNKWIVLMVVFSNKIFKRCIEESKLVYVMTLIWNHAAEYYLPCIVHGLIWYCTKVSKLVVAVELTIVQRATWVLKVTRVQICSSQVCLEYNIACNLEITAPRKVKNFQSFVRNECSLCKFNVYNFKLSVHFSQVYSKFVQQISHPTMIRLNVQLQRELPRTRALLHNGIFSRTLFKNVK